MTTSFTVTALDTESESAALSAATTLILVSGDLGSGYITLEVSDDSYDENFVQYQGVFGGVIGASPLDLPSGLYVKVKLNNAKPHADVTVRLV